MTVETVQSARLANLPGQPGRQSRFLTPQVVFSVLAGYFLLHVGIRVWLSASADLDETDQIILCQKLSLGYGPQPPLYTWIQIGFFAVLGQSILALSLFKNLLLFCTYLLSYANARLLTGSKACGLAAAVSLLFLPQVAWESQRDLTHSVLASTLAAATLYCLLRVLRERTTAWYLLFGLCAGLGSLSKYNYAFWLFGLLAACLTIQQFRPVLRDWRMGLALGLCASIFLPNAIWIFQHRHLALLTVAKFETHQAGPWLVEVWKGMRKLFEVIAAFVGPLVIIYALLFVGRSKSSATTASDTVAPPNEKPVLASPELGLKLILRAIGLILAALVLLVLCFRAQGFRDRWFQPILICTPVIAAVWARDRMNALRLRILSILALFIMTVIAFVIPGRIIWAEQMNREEPLVRPYAELAAQLRSSISPQSYIVTDTRVLGGNLRLSFPATLVLVPELAELFSHHQRQAIFIWDATKQLEPPYALCEWARRNTGANLANTERQYFDATYKFHRSRALRLGLTKVAESP
jgi:4-amino-4-deoxy-L-arabinose transferase-like glycosyltransferase